MAHEFSLFSKAFDSLYEQLQGGGGGVYLSIFFCFYSNRQVPKLYTMNQYFENLISIKTYFYKGTRLPVTRWVKLSLNFESLVKRVMKFLLGQRLFK